MKKNTIEQNNTVSIPIIENEYIEVFGAKEHNLKNLDISIPKIN